MKLHRLDLLALVYGLLFTGTAVALMADHDLWTSRHVNLVWPFAAVALGLALLASGTARHRLSREDQGGAPPPPPGDHPEG
ncbi:MAG: hypothetical protein NVSMB32_14850 [Actinomycetota bacterium]